MQASTLCRPDDATRATVSPRIHNHHPKETVMIRTAFALLFAAFGVFIIVGSLGLMPTFLWFCVDDHIATASGLPALGHLPIWLVWIVFSLISMLFGVIVSKK